MQHGTGLAALRLQKPLLLTPQGMFFYRGRESQELENHAVEPVIKETERMVYVAFSEYFFDSAMHAYFQAGVLAIELEGEKVQSGGHHWAGAGEGGSTQREAGGAARGAALPGAAVRALSQRFLLPAGAQGPGGFAESHLLRDHLHAGEGSSLPGWASHGGALGVWGHGRALAHPLPPQNPAVVDAPLRLVLQVSAPPRCVIKPSGTSVSVSAFLNISLVPAGRPAVQLSSMAMVSAAPPPQHSPRHTGQECCPLRRAAGPKARGQQGPGAAGLPRFSLPRKRS